METQRARLGFMAKSAILHDRVATSILHAAAGVLARSGDAPSMSEVAEAAGVSRATLYRYFPTREALLHALVVAALESISGRLEDAELDSVPVAEGLARVARAIVSVATEYAVLANQPKQVDRQDVENRVGGPIRELMQRGVVDGTLRPDRSVDELCDLFGGLLQGAVRTNQQQSIGVERASALVTSVFLHGTARGGGDD
jgi:TetR/AcrR family transcriptional regulator, mexCD-oprJ operon repressor